MGEGRCTGDGCWVSDDAGLKNCARVTYWVSCPSFAITRRSLMLAWGLSVCPMNSRSSILHPVVNFCSYDTLYPLPRSSPSPYLLPHFLTPIPPPPHLSNPPFKSAPAQKALPAPVTIPTLKLGSLSNQLQIASNSLFPAELMQFSALGRLRVTRRMCAGEG